MKRTVTGIAAAALAIGTLVPAAFAATTTAPSYTKAGTVAFALNGTTVSNPYILDSKDSGNTTAFAPVYYFDQLLGQAGITASWNGSTHTWALTDSSVDASKVTVAGGVGTGNTTITLNGVVIKKINTFAAKDPSGGASAVETTYFPAYYVNNIFAAVGINAKWDGTTGLAVSTAATGFTAKQTAATTVEVDFNGAVASGTKVTLTQNGINYNATAKWNANDTVATLDTGYNLPAGTYTVTAGSLTGTVTIAAAVPSAIKVSTAGFSAIAGAALSYSVVDQFGNAVDNLSTADFTINAFDSTSGKSVTVTPGSTVGTATLNLSGASKGDNVLVTVTDAKYALSNTVTLPVVGLSKIASLTLGTASDNGSANVVAGDTGVVLNYTAKDAAGNSVTFDPSLAAGSTLDGIQFVSSNASVIDPTSFATDSNGHLTFTAKATGTATITAVNLTTGSVATATITVGSSTGVSKFTVSAPSSMVTVGNAVQIPYTAVDSFGQQIAQADFGATQQGHVTVSSSNTSVVPNANIKFDASNALTVTPAATGSTTLYVYVDGTLQNSVTLSVNAASYPVKVTGVTGVPQLFENGATATFDASNFTTTDQYNQSYTPTATDSIYLAYVSGTQGLISLNNNSVSGTGSFTITGTGTGTTVENAVYEVYVKDANGDVTPAYTFNVGYVPTTSVTGYKATIPTTLYDGANGYALDNNTAADYNAAVTLTGTTASGQSVQLTTADATPSVLTSSDPSVVTVVNGNELQGKSAGTAVITAYDKNGNKVGTQTVTVSDAVPVAKTASFSSSTINATAISDITGALKVTDQYGVTLKTPGGYWFSSNSAVVTGGTTPTFGAGHGTATVTYVAPNGVTASVTVTH